MTIIVCDKCKKELKDSDNYWEAHNWNCPFYEDKHVCAQCMDDFLKDEDKPC